MPMSLTYSNGAGTGIAGAARHGPEKDVAAPVGLIHGAGHIGEGGFREVVNACTSHISAHRLRGTGFAQEAGDRVRAFVRFKPWAELDEVAVDRVGIGVDHDRDLPARSPGRRDEAGDINVEEQIAVDHEELVLEGSIRGIYRGPGGAAAAQIADPGYLHVPGRAVAKMTAAHVLEVIDQTDEAAKALCAEVGQNGASSSCPATSTMGLGRSLSPSRRPCPPRSRTHWSCSLRVEVMRGFHRLMRAYSRKLG